MNPIIWLLVTVIDLYVVVVFVTVIVNLLIHFNILNLHQPLVGKVYEILTKMTEPALKRIRRYMPDLGGIDISPIILLLALEFIKRTIIYLYINMM